MRPPDEVEHQRDDCGRVRFQKEVSAVEHMRFDLTLEFTREQYVAARIPSERWEADWRVMRSPTVWRAGNRLR